MVGHRLVVEPASVPSLSLKPSMNNAMTRNLESPDSLQRSSLPSASHGSLFPSSAVE